jgi:hypothetical protein
MDKNRPYVICICPTYNRRNFLPNLLYMFSYQTYPKDRILLLILDDSEISNEDIIINSGLDNIKYIYSNEKMKLGKKRNILNDKSIELGAEYIICFDDDDYYPEDKVSYTIRMMLSRKALISGCTIIYVYYTSLEKIYKFGPYNNNHCTNGTMSYHVNFIKNSNRKYEDEAFKSEEKYFLNNFSEEILQLEPLKVILCISHMNNTVDKIDKIKYAELYDQKLKKIIKDKKILYFYKKLN